VKKLYEIQEKQKRTFLVSIFEKSINEYQSLELEGLSESLGLEIITHEKVRVREKSAKFGMGSGKAEEISQKAAELEADLIVLDWNSGLDSQSKLKEQNRSEKMKTVSLQTTGLSPSQQRNWESLCGIPVLDRQELIIQIFANRASTKEAELQVKLAELTYFLPRLTHKYIDLSRQRGGRYGTKGSGETKFETDRRKIEKQITNLEKEIEQIKKQRQMQRKQRQRNKIPVGSIVGYTNSGKSSLLNVLTSANVLAENKLFATLDAVTRRFQPSPEVQVLLTDTVGFIRSLPHSLIKAFRSTLEEAAIADFLIHILDASDPDIENNYDTTNSVLRELGAENIPVIILLNKIDRLPPDRDILDGLLTRFPESIAVSVKEGRGLELLKERVAAMSNEQ